MPRKTLPPRLWLRPAANGQPAEYLILDRGKQVRVGTDKATAERALSDYLVKDYDPRAKRPGEQKPVADALLLYANDVVPGQARPHATKARIRNLAAFFGEKYATDLNGALCRAYVKHRGSESAAARELHDLRAAMLHANREGLIPERVSLWIPDRAPARDRWLTRDEVAKLLREARRRKLRHICAFILCGLYTGQRAGRICEASLSPSKDHGFFDLDRGLFMPKPGRPETNKRQPKTPIYRGLLAHMRRWKRNGQCYAIERNGVRVMRMDHGFRDVAKAAGLDDVHPHILRHTCATWLMQQGTDIWAASGFLGMSPAIIERVYGHHHPKHLESVLGAFDRSRAA